MKKDITIIGGAGPEAGILLAKLVVAICQKKYGCKRDADFPYLVLLSFPFSEMLKHEGEKKENVSKELETLLQNECAFAQCWAMACQTLHSYLPQKLPSTFINMLEESARRVTQKPVVFCSSTSKKYQIHKTYFDCDYPCNKEQKQLDTLIDELVANEPSLSIFNRFMTITELFKNREIILGCTEFSLLHHYFPLPASCIDPMQITAEKICLSHFKKINQVLKNS